MRTEYADTPGRDPAMASLAARLGCTVAEAEERLADGRAVAQLRSAAPPQGTDCGCAACDVRYRSGRAIDGFRADGPLVGGRAHYRAGDTVEGARAFRRIVERRDQWGRDPIDGAEACAAIMARRAG